MPEAGYCQVTFWPATGPETRAARAWFYGAPGGSPRGWSTLWRPRAFRVLLAVFLTLSRMNPRAGDRLIQLRTRSRRGRPSETRKLAAAFW